MRLPNRPDVFASRNPYRPKLTPAASSTTLPGHVGQAEVAALEAVGQPRVVEAEQVQHRGVQVVDVDPVLDDVEAEVVGLAERDARLDPAAGQPHREGVRVVVAAVVAPLDHRRAAELAAPDDQRVVEQPALLQVLDQRGAGLVGVVAVASSGR